jgi:hypothetical protein
VSTWLPRVFSRAKIWAHSPGSYLDRFDLLGKSGRVISQILGNPFSVSNSIRSSSRSILLTTIRAVNRAQKDWQA